MKLSGLSFSANTSKNFKLNLVLVLVLKLQLAIHRVQNRHAGEQNLHWDKTNKGHT